MTVSNKLGEDYDLVKNIVSYEFLFARQVMQDKEDTHDILLNKLFKFKLKPRFKEDKQSKYSPK